MKTNIHKDAGLEAEWNEEFELHSITKQIDEGEGLVLEAFDDDNFIGSTYPIPYY